jgi:hypothetical protein
MNLDKRNFLRSLLFFLPLSLMKRNRLFKGESKSRRKRGGSNQKYGSYTCTAMHSYLEYHIAGQGLLDLTESGVEAKRMAEVVVEKGLGDLDENLGL